MLTIVQDGVTHVIEFPDITRVTVAQFNEALAEAGVTGVRALTTEECDALAVQHAERERQARLDLIADLRAEYDAPETAEMLGIRGTLEAMSLDDLRAIWSMLQPESEDD